MAPSSSNTPESPPRTPRGALTSLTLPSPSSSSSSPLPTQGSEHLPLQAPDGPTRPLPPPLDPLSEAILSQLFELMHLNGPCSPDIPELQARRDKEHYIPLEGVGPYRLALWVGGNDKEKYEGRIEEIELEGERVPAQDVSMCVCLCDVYIILYSIRMQRAFAQMDGSSTTSAVGSLV